MKLDLNINFKKYIASRLNLNEFIFLQCIYNKDYKEAAFTGNTVRLRPYEVLIAEEA